MLSLMSSDSISQPTSVSVSRLIAAPAADIFAILADPSMHSVIDGSGTVRSAAMPRGTTLKLGSKFGMKMRLGLPYRINNTVVEFEQDRLIAWSHIGGHRWRYTLEPADDGTLVTETFDWTEAKSRAYIEKLGWPARHEGNMTKTLQRLDALVVNRRQPL